MKEYRIMGKHSKENIENYSNDKEKAYDTDDDFTPFTLVGESNDTTDSYSKYESNFDKYKNASRLKITGYIIASIIIIAIVGTLVFNTSNQSSMKSNAEQSISNFNNSIDSLKSISDNNETLMQEVSDFANQQNNNDDKTNATNLSNTLRASSANEFTPVTTNQSNEEAANNVALYFAMCDLANSATMKGLNTNQVNSLKDSCEAVEKSANQMMTDIIIWNHSKDSLYGKISLTHGDKMPDVTSL